MPLSDYQIRLLKQHHAETGHELIGVAAEPVTPEAWQRSLLATRRDISGLSPAQELEVDLSGELLEATQAARPSAGKDGEA